MAFDPKAYLSAGEPASAKAPPPAPSGGAFDPKAYLADPEPAAATEKETPSKLESLGRGALQGASLGWSDEIGAALEAAFTPKSYDQAVGEARANNKAAKDANPWSYGAGEVGGGIATGLATGGAAAGLGATGLAGAAGVGAATGALSGAGSGEGLEDSAKKALIGGTAGAALGAAGNKIFGKVAEGAAAKAAGTTSKAVTAAGDTAAGEYEWAGPAAAAAARGKAELAALTPRAGDLAKHADSSLASAAGTVAAVAGGPGTGIVTGLAVKGAQAVGKAGTKVATGALASLVRGARAGDLTKAAVLNALDQGVSAATVQGVLAGAKNVGPWSKEFLGSND